VSEVFGCRAVYVGHRRYGYIGSCGSVCVCVGGVIKFFKIFQI